MEKIFNPKMLCVVFFIQIFLNTQKAMCLCIFNPPSKKKNPLKKTQKLVCFCWLLLFGC